MTIAHLHSGRPSGMRRAGWWNARAAAAIAVATAAGISGCAPRPGRPAADSATPTPTRTAARHGPRAPSTTFEQGDVFVGLDDGSVEWHGPDGALVATLDTGAKAETGGMTFDAGGSLLVANSGPDGVTSFGADGKRLGPFGSGYDDHPKSVVFDRSQNAYVGEMDGGRAILKFNPDEIEVAAIKAPTESRGTDWIDLAADGHTLYYTSQGRAIKRFDLASQAPLPDFGPALPSAAAFALRIQPDGGVLVADTVAVMRLTASGRVAQNYKAPQKVSWVALALDPSGDSFWAGDRDSGAVCRFDLQSGSVIESFNVRAGAKVCGLVVRGEPRAALAGVPPVAAGGAPAGAAPSAPPSSVALQPGGAATAASAPGPAATPAVSSPPGATSALTPAVALDTSVISAANVGGVVESITGEYGPGQLGDALIDGRPDTQWKAAAASLLPVEIVFSFIHRQPALVSAVTIVPSASGSHPKDVEVWTSSTGPADGFVRRAAQTLTPGLDEQTVSFSAVDARFVKLRLASSYQPGAMELNEVRIVEGRKPGYATLAERDPEMAVWAHSPRRAAQAGIEWLQVASTSWQKKNNCFGCHSQAQALMGLAVARKNQYVVSDACMKDLSTFTQSRQNPDGTFHNGQFETATQFAAMSLSFWDEAAQARSPSLTRAVNWLATHQAPTGEIPCDHNEPPIDQGSMMTTTNAVFAFEQAFRESGKPVYRTAADKGLAWIAAAPAATTQDHVFAILGLAR